jgi:hypothetical protein
MPTLPPLDPGAENRNGNNVPADRLSIDALVAEAEALRALLGDALGRATQLLVALKQEKRQSKALRAAVASLRQLQLGP